MKQSSLDRVGDRLFSDEQWPEGRIGIDMSRGKIWEVVDGREADLTGLVANVFEFELELAKKSDESIKAMERMINMILNSPTSENMSATQLLEFLTQLMKEAHPGMNSEKLALTKLMIRLQLTPHMIKRALERAAQKSESVDVLRAYFFRLRKIISSL